MECLGGNGYVEAEGEGVMARIYREMPLNSIWEGAGNIMALDLLRALRTGAVAEALAHEFAPAKGAHPRLDRGHRAASSAGRRRPSRRSRRAASPATSRSRRRRAARADGTAAGLRRVLREPPRRRARRLRQPGRRPISTPSSRAARQRGLHFPRHRTHDLPTSRAAPRSSPARPPASASRPAASPRAWA
jgi:hypothetical protein